VSLTLKAEQMLASAGLIEFYQKDSVRWDRAAKETFTFLKGNFPKGGTIRCDDVAVALLPLLEVSEELGAFLQAEKLTQRYWIRHFADLILDRAWPKIRN
jgi:hypothetical protein